MIFAALELANNYRPVYGLIFLFKWLPSQGTDEETPYATDTDLFFANQVIQNACGTQALLSVVFNTEDIELGTELAEFKEFTKEFDPYTRGLALSNSEKIRTAHNSLSGLQHFSFEVGSDISYSWSLTKSIFTKRSSMRKRKVMPSTL